MKKNLLCVAALAAGFLFAQPEAKAQGAYVKIGGGYHFGVGSDIAYNETSFETSPPFGNNYSYSGSRERVNINYGKGISANGTFGYMFNQHFGAELGLGYLIGGKNEKKDSYNRNGSINTDEWEAYSRMLLIQPALVVSAGMEGINPYARFGVVAAKGTVTELYTEMGNNSKSELETQVNGGWGIGLQGGIGAEFKLSDNLAFFSELTMSNLSYSPDNGEITKATYNGRDVLGELTTRERKAEFVDEYSYSSNDKPSDAEPGKWKKVNLPFSTVGLGLGIKMNF